MHSLAVVGIITGIVLFFIGDKHENWDALMLTLLCLILFTITL